MKPRTIVILCLVLFAAAAASNAVMDALSFRYEKSLFPQRADLRSWWDPAQSWRNKWKDGDPKRGEAFPFSSTALVATTDAWHFFKAITIFCILAALILPFTAIFPARWPVWVVVFVGLKVLYGAVFEGLFAHLLLK